MATIKGNALCLDHYEQEKARIDHHDHMHHLMNTIRDNHPEQLRTIRETRSVYRRRMMDTCKHMVKSTVKPLPYDPRESQA